MSLLQITLPKKFFYRKQIIPFRIIFMFFNFLVVRRLFSINVPVYCYNRLSIYWKMKILPTSVSCSLVFILNLWCPLPVDSPTFHASFSVYDLNRAKSRYFRLSGLLWFPPQCFYFVLPLTRCFTNFYSLF